MNAMDSLHNKFLHAQSVHEKIDEKTGGKHDRGITQ